MKIELLDNERIDDLEYKGLKLIQNVEGFCFGIDSILLTNFAKNIKNNCKVIDLGTGTGIIPILLSKKTNAEKLVGVEIQEEVANMAKRSVFLNELENKIEILNENILNLKETYKAKEFDIVVSNPPYKKLNTGILNKENKKLISRHEITASLEDFISVSSYLLKDFGELYMVNRTERLVDLFYLLRKYNIEPKNIRFVCSNKNKESKLVLIKAIKYGKPFLNIEKNLYIYDENGEYTDEIYEIYEKNKWKINLK